MSLHKLLDHFPMAYIRKTGEEKSCLPNEGAKAGRNILGIPGILQAVLRDDVIKGFPVVGKGNIPIVQHLPMHWQCSEFRLVLDFLLQYHSIQLSVGHDLMNRRQIGTIFYGKYLQLFQTWLQKTQKPLTFIFFHFQPLHKRRDRPAQHAVPAYYCSRSLSSSTKSGTAIRCA